MSKNIILLSDGTGNGAAKRNKTNVWRLYEALDLHRMDQVAFYDDGVGAQEFLPFKLLGGAFGYGLKKNIRELYKFLCHNYKPGDRIYLFGFSRGAFTVRMLVGMIAYCGVYTAYKDEQDLEQAARDNYNAFRSKFRTGLLTQWLRKYFGRTEPLITELHPDIEFVGTWDTVDAYGLPIDELAEFWDKFIYPIYFPDYRLSEKVKKACHALSVDDERETFHPLLWDESSESDPGRIEQVWFPGVHSDVGGGYPKCTLALVTLDWMIERVKAVSGAEGSPGIHLIKQCREEILYHSDWHGPQHDSRALVGAYYRYSPRDIEKLCNNEKKGIFIKIPKIHRSVMERVARKVVPYAPPWIPEVYELVKTHKDEDLPEFESATESKNRKLEMLPVYKVIGRRKTLYYCLLLTTLVFLFSPLFSGSCITEGYINGGAYDSLFNLLSKILPDFIDPWIKVLQNSPLFFYALVIVYGLLSLLKSKAWDTTQLLSNRAWSVVKQK